MIAVASTSNAVFAFTLVVSPLIDTVGASRLTVVPLMFEVVPDTFVVVATRLIVVAVILDVVASKLKVVTSVSIVGVLISILPKFSASTGSFPTSMSYVHVILD